VRGQANTLPSSLKYAAAVSAGRIDSRVHGEAVFRDRPGVGERKGGMEKRFPRKTREIRSRAQSPSAAAAAAESSLGNTGRTK